MKKKLERKRPRETPKGLIEKILDRFQDWLCAKIVIDFYFEHSNFALNIQYISRSSFNLNSNFPSRMNSRTVQTNFRHQTDGNYQNGSPNTFVRLLI